MVGMMYCTIYLQVIYRIVYQTADMLAEFSLHNPLDLVPSVHNISTEYPIVVDEKVCNIITLYVSLPTSFISF